MPPEASENPHLLKHLDYIQTTISRMASHSFMIKGWSVTVAAAILAFNHKSGHPEAAWIVLLPTLMFWGLDGFILRQERLFRKLFDHVRENPTRGIGAVDFSMNTAPYANLVGTVPQVCCSRTLGSFYGVLVAVILLVWLAGPSLLRASNTDTGKAMNTTGHVAPRALQQGTAVK